MSLHVVAIFATSPPFLSPILLSPALSPPMMKAVWLVVVVVCSLQPARGHRGQAQNANWKYAELQVQLWINILLQANGALGNFNRIPTGVLYTLSLLQWQFQ